MYFKISDAFLDQRDELSTCSFAVRNLLGSMRSGYHHLVISRELVDVILLVCDLSRQEQELLKANIRQKYTISASEVKSTYAYVECIPSQGVPPQVPQNALAIKLRHYQESAQVSPTRMIVEDLVRDRLGIEILLGMFQRHVLRGAGYRFEYLHGGGSMTATAFAAAALDPRPAICVVDSDKRSPICEMGATAKAVMQVLPNVSFPSSLALVLPVRELENALPLRSIKIAYESIGANDVGSSCQHLIDFCEACPAERSARETMVAFLDFKSGLNSSDIEVLADYNRNILKALWSHSNDQSDSPEPEESSFLEKNPFTGISRNTLEVVGKCFDQQNYRFKDARRNLLKHPMFEELQRFCETIMCYGAAPKPLPVQL